MIVETMPPAAASDAGQAGNVERSRNKTDRKEEMK
jgi:hypothetical protein